MLNLLFILSFFLCAYEIIRESIEPVAPKGTRFDWNAYQRDIDNGMPCMEQVRKRQSGAYTTTMPMPERTVIANDIVDVKRYLHDKEVYGKTITESWRRSGLYKFVK